MTRNFDLEGPCETFFAELDDGEGDGEEDVYGLDLDGYGSGSYTNPEVTDYYLCWLVGLYFSCARLTSQKMSLTQ